MGSRNDLAVMEETRAVLEELSPRPHNTFHATETACATSQFEQLIRAICDLPLGSTEIVRPTALACPGVALRLYGKAPRPNRKLGHLLATASTPREALRRVSEARLLLGPA